MLKKTISYICIFIVLVILLFLVYILFKKAFTSLTPTSATVMVGVFAGLFTITSLIISKHYEQKIIIANKHRDKKIPVYEELINFIFKMTMAGKTCDKAPTEKEIADFMSNFIQKIIVWGSDEVILAYYRFREFDLNSPNNSKTNLLFIVEDLLFSIRKDLGHKNKDLTKGKLLGLFINDLNEYLIEK